MPTTINNTVVTGEFQARYEWSGPPAQVRPGDVWPITGTATVVKNSNYVHNAGGEIRQGLLGPQRGPTILARSAPT